MCKIDHRATLASVMAETERLSVQVNKLNATSALQLYLPLAAGVGAMAAMVAAITYCLKLSGL